MLFNRAFFLGEKYGLAHEEMKNCVWVKPERSCKSSSVNGRRMVTCDIQSLWGYVRTKSLAQSCLNDDDSYPKARMSCLFTLRTCLRYGQPSSVLEYLYRLHQ